MRFYLRFRVAVPGCIIRQAAQPRVVAPPRMKKIAILGGGSWGTALAIALMRSRQPHRIALWVHGIELAHAIQATRVNEVYLPGFELPGEVAVTSDIGWSAG